MSKEESKKLQLVVVESSGGYQSGGFTVELQLEGRRVNKLCRCDSMELAVEIVQALNFYQHAKNIGLVM